MTKKDWQRLAQWVSSSKAAAEKRHQESYGSEGEKKYFAGRAYAFEQVLDWLKVRGVTPEGVSEVFGATAAVVRDRNAAIDAELAVSQLKLKGFGG